MGISEGQKKMVAGTDHHFPVPAWGTYYSYKRQCAGAVYLQYILEFLRCLQIMQFVEEAGVPELEAQIKELLRLNYPYFPVSG